MRSPNRPNNTYYITLSFKIFFPMKPIIFSLNLAKLSTTFYTNKRHSFQNGQFQKISIPNHGWLPYFNPPPPCLQKFQTALPPPQCPQNSKLINPPPLQNFRFFIKPFGITFLTQYNTSIKSNEPEI